MTEIIKINYIPGWRRWWFALVGKDRNKRLLKLMAAWNNELSPPAFLNSALNISPADLAFLNLLARRVEGWHPFEFSAAAGPGDHRHLAALGLIRLARRKQRIFLYDAGRFLLSLNAITPSYP